MVNCIHCNDDERYSRSSSKWQYMWCRKKCKKVYDTKNWHCDTCAAEAGDKILCFHCGQEKGEHGWVERVCTNKCEQYGRYLYNEYWHCPSCAARAISESSAKKVTTKTTTKSDDSCTLV